MSPTTASWLPAPVPASSSWMAMLLASTALRQWSIHWRWPKRPPRRPANEDYEQAATPLAAALAARTQVAVGHYAPQGTHIACCVGHPGWRRWLNSDQRLR